MLKSVAGSIRNMSIGHQSDEDRSQSPSQRNSFGAQNQQPFQASNSSNRGSTRESSNSNNNSNNNSLNNNSPTNANLNPSTHPTATETTTTASTQPHRHSEEHPPRSPMPVRMSLRNAFARTFSIRGAGGGESHHISNMSDQPVIRGDGTFNVRMANNKTNNENK